MKINRVTYRKVNKRILLRNVIVCWLTLYMIILFLWIISALTFIPENIDFPVFRTVTIIFILIYFLLFLTHHILALYYSRKGTLLSSEEADGWIVRLLFPAGVRKGKRIGVRLHIYLKRVGGHEWNDKLFNYLIIQECSVERPLILRSHLLSSPKFVAHLVIRLKERGLHCSVSHDLPVNSRFKLQWFTAANLAAFQFYLPTLREKETEIIITPAAAILNSSE